MVSTVWLVVILVLCTPSIHAQYMQVQADTVLYTRFADGAQTGRGPAFFPANVLRGPDPQATDTTPTIDPREICALGIGGEIGMGLKAHVIVDGPGADFIVFENSFLGPRGLPYAEPAQVSVSRDGVHWVPFPFDSATLVGCAGITPTSGGDPWNPLASGGDAFDLSHIGMDSVRWIRIVDTCRLLINNPEHRYYDPTLNGFDLDAICILHAVRKAYQTSVTVIPRTTAITASIAAQRGTVRVFDVCGMLLLSQQLAEGVYTIELGTLATTCLFVVVEAGGQVETTKVLQ